MAPPAPRSLRECRDCGQFQMLPALPPRALASCLRCNAVLRRTRVDPMGASLALSIAGLVLFGVAASTRLMTLDSAGQQLQAGLFSGPEGLERDGLWELAAVVLVTTVAAPVVRMLGLTYVLVGLRLPRPPLHLRGVFGFLLRLRPWAMVEVFLLGVFVAYVKLIDMAQVHVGPALYALGGVMLLTAAADAALDPEAVWEAMARRHIPDAESRANRADPDDTKDAIGCETCALVSRPTGPRPACPRCGAALHRRKPDSIARTWALTLAAMVLYLPANIYPVMVFTSLGSGEPNTILSGVQELLTSGMWPLALLVFFASITVPVLKLISLTLMLVMTQRRSAGRLRDRTRLYRIVELVGRWSMIDVFMISILVALVQFGAVITIQPGPGALAFASVVILTMFAAGTFDPRLMWDRARR